MHLVDTCVTSTAELVDAYDETARDIKVSTLIRAVGVEELSESFSMYQWGRGNGMRLLDDWHVSASVGKYKGKKCYCLMWSCIHHFFTN